MHVPFTTVRTSHALTIKANGVDVGLINGWQSGQGRTLTPVFEVSADDSGNPKEVVPGNMSGLSLNINRYDTYITRMEQAFGTPDLVMLTRQNQPFDCIEKWIVYDPSGMTLVQHRMEEGVSERFQELIASQERFIYQGCWFGNLGRQMRADDVRIVNVNATLMYTKKLRITAAMKAAGL